jgi:hypothetical protein
MGFLRLLLFVILGYYLLKIIGRLMAPFLAKYAARKSQEFFARAYRSSDYSNSRQNVGEVTIETQKHKTPKSSKPVGEYISFEEIE